MTVLVLALLLQHVSSTPETAARSWSGCLQAGTAPSTYRLNLEPDGAGTRAADGVPEPAGTAATDQPFVQLVSATPDLDLTEHVGKRVRVTGRELSREEAEKEAAKRPNRQEAAETAAGTGGESPQHLRYVRVQRVERAAGTCK